MKILNSNPIKKIKYTVLLISIISELFNIVQNQHFDFKYAIYVLIIVLMINKEMKLKNKDITNKREWIYWILTKSFKEINTSPSFY